MAKVLQQHEAQLRATSAGGLLPFPVAAQATTFSTRVGAERATLQWPHFTVLWNDVGGGSAFKRLKVHIRLWRARSLGPALVTNTIAPFGWQSLFADDTARLYPAVSHFMDRRWTMTQRFDHVASDLEYARAAFGPAVCYSLAHGEAVELARIDADMRLVLEPNTISYHEGLWAISLRAANGARLYTSSFAFLARNQLLIGTLQGPNFESDSRETLRDLTKRCHGLRPAPLLITALQRCAPHLGISALYGIDPEHHIKGRWNLRNRRLRFDYRALYSELGGARAANGYWDLPVIAQHRDSSTIPSRKRAEYRRRYEMLDAMSHAIQIGLSLRTASTGRD
jgi:uncharacterized protein